MLKVVLKQYSGLEEISNIALRRRDQRARGDLNPRSPAPQASDLIQPRLQALLLDYTLLLIALLE